MEYSRLYGGDVDDFTIPLAMTFTRYHVLLLFSEKVIAVSLVAPADRNASQVMDEDYCSDVSSFIFLLIFYFQLYVCKNYNLESW